MDDLRLRTTLRSVIAVAVMAPAPIVACSGRLAGAPNGEVDGTSAVDAAADAARGAMAEAGTSDGAAADAAVTDLVVDAGPSLPGCVTADLGPFVEVGAPCYWRVQASCDFPFDAGDYGEHDACGPTCWPDGGVASWWCGLERDANERPRVYCGGRGVSRSTAGGPRRCSAS